MLPQKSQFKFHSKNSVHSAEFTFQKQLIKATALHNVKEPNLYKQWWDLLSKSLLITTASHSGLNYTDQRNVGCSVQKQSRDLRFIFATLTGECLSAWIYYNETEDINMLK